MADQNRELTKDEVKAQQRSLTKAIIASQTDIVNNLLEGGLPVDRASFHAATLSNSIAIWRVLVSHGWDLNDTRYGSSALSLSTENPALVKWMLDNGADPNLTFQRNRGSSYEYSAIGSATACDHLESIKILVENGATLRKTQLESCLAWVNHDKIRIETMQYLLNAGIDVNVVIEAGRGTPLQLAVRRGMTEKAELLLRAGAYTNVKNEDGLSLLQEAENLGNPRMIELLLSYST